MNAFTLLTTMSYLLITCESTFSFKPVVIENNTDSYLNTLQIIRKYGYPGESHIVETEDGYLLEMHRIPPPKKSNSQEKKLPVFIQHGLLGSSADYLLIGPDSSLPFLLSNMGFDVWLGNVRGNQYSRANSKLFPDDQKFWNFTWHQSAIYDLPAEINFICNHTKHEKIIYIGFSMGTTMFFVMTSTLPQFNNKIELSLLMAPVAYMTHIRSPFLRFLAPFSTAIASFEDLVAKGEFLPDCKLLKFFSKYFCDLSQKDVDLCMNSIFVIVGSDPKEFDKKLLPTLINHFPEGYSVKAVNHYAQLLKSGKFRQYDYGPKGNKIQYGMVTPPDYNVESIRVPMYFYGGENDYLSSLQDVKTFSNRLNTLMKLRVIQYPQFSHMDFMVAIDVKKLVYDILISDLMSHLTENNVV